MMSSSIYIDILNNYIKYLLIKEKRKYVKRIIRANV